MNKNLKGKVTHRKWKLGFEKQTYLDIRDNVINSHPSVWWWVEWWTLDTANTSSCCCDLESHVTLFTPGCAPWVSHEPVVNTGGSTPTNNVGGVIKIGAAEWAVKNTASVVLENCLISFDWNRKWFNGKSSFHLTYVVGCNVSVASCLNSGCWCWVVFTGWGNSSVWVGALRFSSVGFVVVEGLILPTTIATVVCSWAINKLLFRERKQGSRSDFVWAFQCWGRWKGPAWTALTLIFDCLNSTCGNPVNRVGDVSLIKYLIVLFRFWHWSVSENSLVFLLAPVTHLVETKFECWFRKVVCDDCCIVACELFKSELVFSGCSIGFTKLGDISHEGLFDFWCSGDCTCECEGE